MSAQLATLIAAIIAAVVSLIAAAASFYAVYYQSTRSSRLRLAEFRREWIEVLRIKMAEFLAIHFQRDSVSTLINGSFNDTDNLFESTKKHIELTTSLGERLSYVQLSLNSSETAHRELIDIMYFMVNNPLPEVEKEYQRVGFKFTEKAGEVLKSEWTRLKQEM